MSVVGGEAAVAGAEFFGEVTVRRIRYANESSGWAVLEACRDDGSSLVLVGPLVHLEERERARVTGTWVDDSRFGPQVKVAEAHPLSPSDAAAVVAYLRRVRHVGAARAQAAIDRFGLAGVLDAIDRDPFAAFVALGVGRHRAREAADSWEGLRASRRLHLLLAPHGLAYLVGRIQAEHGSMAHRVVSERPYELTSVFGVGFHVADRIARSVGARVDGIDRARAGVLHLLAEAERSGSTCVPAPALGSRLDELLGMEVELSPLVTELARTGDVVRAGEWVYRAETAALEAELAERVRGLLEGGAALGRGSGAGGSEAGTEAGAGEGVGAVAGDALASERLAGAGAGAGDALASERLAGAGAGAGDALTPEQIAGVHGAAKHRLSLITGGPGTGKTASIRAIGALAAARGARVLLAAPTGRAAIRMTEATGLRARTVHSVLGWIPGEGPTHDEDDPLACDLLIVDESSMANLELLVTLLRAVGESTHVVLVGDADQLAPVGAGKPFAELVESGLVPTTRLTHIFRQAAGSMIVQGAHAIRRGSAPDFVPTEGMRRDLFLISRASAVAAREEIVSLVSSRLPSHYGVDPVRDIQVFAPVYRGELGIDRLNEALREALNPSGSPVRGGRLRLGDKLMLTGRNLHELGLMNGMLLRLLDEVSGEPAGGSRRGSAGGWGRGSAGDLRRGSAGDSGRGSAGDSGRGSAEGSDSDDPALILSAEDTGAIFRLPPEDADRLRLAYACSVHRGQGIELPVAVIVAHPAGGAFFLRREMLYTAITRAKLATVIVGTREVVARAARTADTGRRHSRLAERLAAGVGSARSGGSGAQ